MSYSRYRRVNTVHYQASPRHLDYQFTLGAALFTLGDTLAPANW